MNFRTINEGFENRYVRMLNERDVEQGVKSSGNIVYQDKYWIVRLIETAEDARKFGRNTNWAIAGGKSSGRNRETAEKWFDSYSDEGITFLFFESKSEINGQRRWACAFDGSGNCEIYDSYDETTDEIPGFSRGKRLELISSVQH